MKILAIETATEACSAALLIDDEVVEQYQLAPRQHTKLILPMMDDLLNQAGIQLNQLDALAFGRGPGAFTGVRIAAGVIQGAAFGADLPVVPVSTLAALAQQGLDCCEDRLAFAALDARMAEVYWGVYQRGADGLAKLVGSEAVVIADNVEIPGHDVGTGIGIGMGWDTYREDLSLRLGARIIQIQAQRYPKAAEIARLSVPAFEQGEAVPAEKALPVYLRDKVAKKRSER